MLCAKTLLKTFSLNLKISVLPYTCGCSWAPSVRVGHSKNPSVKIQSVLLSIWWSKRLVEWIPNICHFNQMSGLEVIHHMQRSLLTIYILQYWTLNQCQLFNIRKNSFVTNINFQTLVCTNIASGCPLLNLKSFFLKLAYCNQYQFSGIGLRNIASECPLLNIKSFFAQTCVL